MRSVLLQWPFLTDISLGLAAASIFQVAPLPPGDVPDTAQAEAVQVCALSLLPSTASHDERCFHACSRAAEQAAQSCLTVLGLAAADIVQVALLPPWRRV